MAGRPRRRQACLLPSSLPFLPFCHPALLPCHVMVVGLLTVELHVPGSQSLKEKRMVLRRIKDRLKKFNVAVSEVDHQDLWQRAALAVVTVSTEQKQPHRELAAG